MKDLFLMVSSVGAIFLGGLLFQGFWILGSALLVLGIVLQFVRERRQKFIKGEGLSTISVGDTPPKNPKEGDLWVDKK